jgi:hypothetical protein
MSDMVRIAGKVKLAAGRCAGRGQLDGGGPARYLSFDKKRQAGGGLGDVPGHDEQAVMSKP